MTLRINPNRNVERILEGGRVYPTAFRVLRNTGGSYFLACCGMSGLEGFNSVPTSLPYNTWAEKSELMALLYRELFLQGTVIYALTSAQVKTNALHQDFLKCGAQLISEFPNLYHGPEMISLFKLNIRNLCGRFCNKYGEVYAEPPKDESEVLPEQTEAHTRGGAGDPLEYEHNGLRYRGRFVQFPVKPQ